MVTKGARSITPQRPSQSLGELILGWVKVEHDPSGIPVIDAADLDVRLRRGRPGRASSSEGSRRAAMSPTSSARR